MRRWHAVAVFAALLGFPSALSAQARKDNWDLCFSHDPGLSIIGCSAIIQTGAETDTSYAKAFDNRGIAYMQKREYDRAILDYDQALRLNPSSANAFYNRALTYRLKGDYEHAIQDYDQALRLTPRDPDSFYGRSLSYAHEGAYLRAIADHGHWWWLTFGVLGVIRECLFWIALGFGVAQWFRRFEDENARLRRFVGWVFAAESVLYLEAALRNLPTATRQHPGVSLLTLAFLILVAFVSGLAWWAILKAKPSAKGCAVAASLMQILVFFRQFVPPSRPASDYHAVSLLVGIVGLFAFLWRNRPIAKSKEEQPNITSLFSDQTANS